MTIDDIWATHDIDMHYVWGQLLDNSADDDSFGNNLFLLEIDNTDANVIASLLDRVFPYENR